MSDFHWHDCGIAGGQPHPASAHRSPWPAPDESKRIMWKAVKTDGWIVRGVYGGRIRWDRLADALDDACHVSRLLSIKR